MLEADHWERVLANVRATVVGRTERVSCHQLLDLLKVEADPAVRARVAKRSAPVCLPAVPELDARVCTLAMSAFGGKADKVQAGRVVCL